MSTAAPLASAPGRVAIIGNYAPRRCGIATFTHDLAVALGQGAVLDQPLIVAMTDDAGPYDYPREVVFEIGDQDRAAYAAAADYLNFAGVDAVILQHEYGIFGGEAGDYVLDLLRRLRMPVVTTLHTVLTAPDAAQRRVMEAVIQRSARLVVMAEIGRDILIDTWGVPADRIAVIPHGVPDRPFLDNAIAKEELGFGDRELLLTFGLLGPGKGIEAMVDALPAVIKRHPTALYLVLGATHPTLVRHEGERYRDGLKARAAGLGVGDHIVFIDKFVDDEELIHYLTAADIYVTPYPNEAQITSGTLAISFGLGKPIVSTPFWHARELLADGRGLLVPFGDSAAMAAAIGSVLSDPAVKSMLRKRAYAAGRATIWPAVAERYAELFAAVAEDRRGRGPNVLPLVAGMRTPAALPALSLDHLDLMTDGCGLAQHAILSVPDRAHGYCLDDNARALLLMAKLQERGAWGPRETRLARTYAAFTQHAWRADPRRFRNFMAFSREWLDDVGADDAHGRAVWALGALAEKGAPQQLGDWATALFLASAPAASELPSPRGWAYAMMGATAFLTRFGGHRAIGGLVETLAARLADILVRCATPDWYWFEDRLAYDNAVLPQALIAAGVVLDRADYRFEGVRALEWLMARQTAPAGHFRPVGSDSFGQHRVDPKPFDQQALEAQSAIGACATAYGATTDDRWLGHAHRAFAWFMGANDLRVMMTDAEAGAGYDGLHPDRRNANQGAESTLAYLTALSDMAALSARAAAPGRVLAA